MTRAIHHLLVSDSRKYHPRTNVGNSTVSRGGGEKLFLKNSTFSLRSTCHRLALLLSSAFFLPARRENSAAMFPHVSRGRPVYTNSSCGSFASEGEGEGGTAPSGFRRRRRKRRENQVVEFRESQ